MNDMLAERLVTVLERIATCLEQAYPPPPRAATWWGRVMGELPDNSDDSIEALAKRERRRNIADKL